MRDARHGSLQPARAGNELRLHPRAICGPRPYSPDACRRPAAVGAGASSNDSDHRNHRCDGTAPDRGNGRIPALADGARVAGRHWPRPSVLEPLGFPRDVQLGLPPLALDRVPGVGDRAHGRPAGEPVHLRRAGVLSMENRLRILRAERAWSQQDLAGRLEVSRQSVNAIETGKYDPSLPLAFRIAELFDLPIEDIFVSPSRRSSKAI